MLLTVHATIEEEIYPEVRDAGVDSALLPVWGGLRWPSGWCSAFSACPRRDQRGQVLLGVDHDTRDTDHDGLKHRLAQQRIDLLTLAERLKVVRPLEQDKGISAALTKASISMVWVALAQVLYAANRELLKGSEDEDIIANADDY